MTTTMVPAPPAARDDHTQIRIRRFKDVDDGRVRYEVSLGFYVRRGVRRVWFIEGRHTKRNYAAYYDTLAVARRMAANPAWIRERDRIRALRGNPPATAPYTVA